MLYAMLYEELGYNRGSSRVEYERVDCELFSGAFQHHKVICDGCRVVFHEYEGYTWKFFKALVVYCARTAYECMCVDQTNPLVRTDEYSAIFASDCLLICTVGGVPLGTASYSYEEGDLYVGQLCAMTHSRVGSLLIERLKEIAVQQHCNIRVDTGDRARGFYAVHGFGKSLEKDSEEPSLMIWHNSYKKQRIH